MGPAVAGSDYLPVPQDLVLLCVFPPLLQCPVSRKLRMRLVDTRTCGGLSAYCLVGLGVPCCLNRPQASAAEAVVNFLALRRGLKPRPFKPSSKRVFRGAWGWKTYR